MDCYVSPPIPNEHTLTDIVRCDFLLENGRTLEVSISRWHWDMIAFLELWNEPIVSRGGLILEYQRRLPNVTDRRFSGAVMRVIRGEYEDLLRGIPSGTEPVFPDPRR